MKEPKEKASFEIVGTNLADEGIRLMLTDKMIRLGVKYGSIENYGTKKLLISLGGKNKKEIKKFKNLIETNFENWINTEISESVRLTKRIANPGINYCELVFDEGLEVLPINLHSHGLLCQQLRKGVGVFERIEGTIRDHLMINEKLIGVLERKK